MDENSTVFMTLTDRGEVELMTRNFAVMAQARAAREAGKPENFTYSTGEGERTVQGCVTWLNETPRFRFAVLPRNAEG